MSRITPHEFYKHSLVRVLNPGREVKSPGMLPGQVSWSRVCCQALITVAGLSLLSCGSFPSKFEGAGWPGQQLILHTQWGSQITQSELALVYSAFFGVCRVSESTSHAFLQEVWIASFYIECQCLTTQTQEYTKTCYLEGGKDLHASKG